MEMKGTVAAHASTMMERMRKHRLGAGPKRKMRDQAMAPVLPPALWSQAVEW